MSAKQKFVLVAMIIVFTGIVGIINGIFHAVSQDERDSSQRQREWMEFSRNNHCRVVRESSFWDASILWQCDGGFQVKRWSNE